MESSSRRQMDTVAGSCTLGDEDSYIEESCSSLRPFKFRKLQANVAQNSSSCSRIGEAFRRMNRRMDVRIVGGGGGAEAHHCFDLDLNDCPSN